MGITCIPGPTPSHTTMSGLSGQILSILLGQVQPGKVGKQIRRQAHRARCFGDIETLVQLQLLRGEYYLAIGEPALSGKAFRRVMRGTTHEAEAAIGIARSYLQNGQERKAREWLETARSVAESSSDYSGQLGVMEVLAGRAIVTGDDGMLADALESMGKVVSSAPRRVARFPLVVGALLDLGRGAECIRYLERSVERLLALNATYFDYGVVVRYLVNAHRQTGLDDAATRERLLRHRDLIADSATAEAFAERVDCEIGSEPYPVRSSPVRLSPLRGRRARRRARRQSSA